MSDFTDQKPRIATIEDMKGRWGMRRNGTGFRCYLCGHKFAVGEQYRWVYAGGTGLINFLVCQSCDGPAVLDSWRKANEEAARRFWWLTNDL